MAAAEAARGFEQQNFELERLFLIELDDAMGGGEAGDAAADDDDAFHDSVDRGLRMEIEDGSMIEDCDPPSSILDPRPVSSCSRITSAIMRMNVG